MGAAPRDAQEHRTGGTRVAETPPARRRVPLRSTCAQPHSCPLPVRLRVLSRTPMFAGLGEGRLRDVDRRMTSLSWAEGDTLYAEGMPAEHLYVVADGRAKAYRTAPSGQKVVVELLGPGHLFGGVRTLARPVYDKTVEALTTVCALRVGDGVNDAPPWRRRTSGWPWVRPDRPWPWRPPTSP